MSGPTRSEEVARKLLKENQDRHMDIVDEAKPCTDHALIPPQVTFCGVALSVCFLYYWRYLSDAAIGSALLRPEILIVRNPLSHPKHDF